MNILWILSLTLGLSFPGLPAPPISPVETNKDYCELRGAVFVVEAEAAADYTVFVEEVEAFANMLIFEEDSRGFADRPGLWWFTDNYALADFRIFITDIQSFSDFSIYYTNFRSLAGCPQ